MNSIKLHLELTEEETEFGSSKFLGDPDIPLVWNDEGVFGENEIFLFQVNLEEMSNFDYDERLPKRGILSFFLDVTDYPYTAVVRYNDGDIEDLARLEEFNQEVEWEYDLFQEFLIEFSSDDLSDTDGTRFFGKAADLDGADLDNYVVLFQLDPLDCPELNVFSNIDGYVYFLITEEDLENKDFSNVIFYVQQY